MIDNIKSKLLDSPEWVISISVFLIYWIVNKSYSTGPTVLNDEIGYLTNAALISGHIIDGATNYHAGYSFFLAPLFIIFSEPFQIWQAAMVLNAFIWALSFLILARILKVLVPEYKKEKLLVALLISAVYPAWITMSGYVFATTTFVFVYLLAVITLLFWKPDKIWTIIPHCLLVGYLYWIHPVGLAVCVASFLVVSYVSIRERSYASALLSFILIVALITVYREIIDKWLILLATPEGYEPFSQHYPGLERTSARLFEYDYWLEVILKAAGQISYLMVSSFGLIFFGFMASINKSYKMIQKSGKHNEGDNDNVNQTLYSFLILALLGVLAMGAMFLSVGGSTRIDQWIYGRYIEMVVLPLLALGFLLSWSRKWILFASLFILFSGLLLNQFVYMEDINLLFMTAAYWPQYVISENSYLYWMAAGSLGVIFVSSVRKIRKIGNTLAIVSIMAFFIYSIIVQGFVHQHRISAHGTPSAFVYIIRENYPSGTCVGFNLEGFDSFRSDPPRQRYYLHLFYLYDYGYRRMSSEEWLEHCNGPFWTSYLDGLDEQKNVKLIGEEVYTELYLLVKDDGRNIVVPDESKTVRFIDHR